MCGSDRLIEYANLQKMLRPNDGTSFHIVRVYRDSETLALEGLNDELVFKILIFLLVTKEKNKWWSALICVERIPCYVMRSCKIVHRLYIGVSCRVTCHKSPSILQSSRGNSSCFSRPKLSQFLAPGLLNLVLEPQFNGLWWPRTSTLGHVISNDRSTHLKHPQVRQSKTVAKNPAMADDPGKGEVTIPFQVLEETTYSQLYTPDIQQSSR